MSGDLAEGAAPSAGERWRMVLLVVTAALGAAVLFGLVVTLGEATRQRDRALAAQTRSYDVMIQARSLSATIAQAEASLGRYVISGDQALGAIYAAQWKLAGDQIARLRFSLRDNRGQQAMLDRLAADYHERGEELNATALSTRYRRNDQALARYYKARQAAALGRIDTLLDGIIAGERTLLTQRTEAAMAGVARSNRGVLVLIVFGALLVLAAVALGWAALQAQREQALALAEAEEERERAAELAEAVEAATADLRVEAHERAAAEAQLRQAHKMDAVGQLTGGIAHDFNNMLAVILGGLELAGRHADGVALRHIAHATEGANRAAALTKRLLAFARAEPLVPEPLDAATLVAGMRDLLNRSLGGTVKVVARDDGAGWQVWADSHQLENAILNLAVNARDAMEGKGTLTIVTSAISLAAGEVGECAAGDYVTIAVGDTGCGIAPEVIDRVFEPFFTTKPVGQGTGLGLSQIFAFVRQSTGEIAIASEPGAGTTVTLYLPRHVAAAVPRIEPVAVAAEPAPAAAACGCDILVVDDDPRVLAATVDSLAELGHRPVPCDDPAQAGAKLTDMGHVDLILSDVLMPGLTGPEMVAALDPRWAAVPVIFVTGYAGELEGDGFRGRSVLRKPFTLAGLERAVAEVARDREAPRAAA